MMPETGDIALFLLHTYLKGDVSPSERELSPEPVWLSGRGGDRCRRFGGRTYCAARRVGRGVFSRVHLRSNACVSSQPWEPQCFCSNFPHEAVCADPWGQALLVSTDAGVLLVDG